MISPTVLERCPYFCGALKNLFSDEPAAPKKALNNKEKKKAKRKVITNWREYIVSHRCQGQDYVEIRCTV